MEIKTIRYKLDFAEDFDRKVNEALAAGWRLTKREVISPKVDNVALMIYAELVKLDPPQAQPEPDVMAAARLINDLCQQFETCRDCPLDDVCEHRPPNQWDVDEEGT